MPLPITPQVYKDLPLEPQKLILRELWQQTSTFASRGSKGSARDAPRGPKFFQFHAVFGKIWQNRMLAPPGSWRPLLGEILDPPLFSDRIATIKI